MTTEAQKRAMRNYYLRNKANTRVYMFRLNKERDADVIAALDAEQNKAEFLRKLVKGAKDAD